MSLQGIAVSISPSGIQYFTNVLLASELSKALQGLQVPDRTINIAGGLPYYSNGKLLAGAAWPPPTFENYAGPVTISLTGGSLTGFNPAFGGSGVSQGDNGEFTFQLVAQNFSANYHWHEQYEEYQCSSYTGYDPPNCADLGSRSNDFNYSIAFQQMTITIVFQFEFADNEWQFKFIRSSPEVTGINPNIPPGSIVTHARDGCSSPHVTDATKSAVEAIDFGPPISALLGPLFGSIPASGHLTPNIIFDLGIGPSGLTFPGNAGLSAGVTGNVTYNKTPYNGPNPPQLTLPAIDPNYHLHYYVSDYTFNGLFWAFFSEGDLVATATQGNVPDGGALNTSSYQNTPLQALYTAYPDKPMTANIKALQAPSVQFKQIYDLTKENVLKLQKTLPQAVYTQLQSVVGSVFLDEPSFYAAVVNALGPANAAQYKTAIELVAQIVGAVVTHSDQVILNVIDTGNTIPVITFDVSQIDVLQDFKLGIAGSTQTLQFAFQIVTALTTTKFISSPIPGINSGDFGFIWNFVLQPVYGNVVAAIGKAGVALPRIKGFDFLFDKADINLASGYADVLADVQHASDAGLLYLLSKPMVRFDSFRIGRRSRDVRNAIA